MFLGWWVGGKPVSGSVVGGMVLIWLLGWWVGGQ